LQFTIDTAVGSYDDALRTVRAAYGRTEEPVRSGLRHVLPDGAVWQASGRYAPPAWTEEMLREWVDLLNGLSCLDLVWRVCSEPGPPGVRGQVLAEYINPHLTGHPALPELSLVSRRLNAASRQVGGGRAPWVIDEKTRVRTVHPVVAAIVIDQLQKKPLWPKLRHHTDPPPDGSRGHEPGKQ